MEISVSTIDVVILSFSTLWLQTLEMAVSAVAVSLRRVEKASTIEPAPEIDILSLPLKGFYHVYTVDDT